MMQEMVAKGKQEKHEEQVRLAGRGTRALAEAHPPWEETSHNCQHSLKGPRTP